jgi:hypothetical protein
MPVSISPEALEAVSKASWVFMFEGEGKLPPLDPEVSVPPNRDYALTAAKMPEAIEMHKKTITALLQNDFDLDRSVRSQLSGGQGFNDLPDRARLFRTRLCDYLKKWCREHL